MKLALVHRRYSLNGGTERWLVGFTRWLVASGHTPTVVCAEVRPDLASEPGVSFLRVATWRPARMLSFAWSARQALRGQRWDAVMGFGRTADHHVFRAGGGSHASYLRRVHPLRARLSPVDALEVALDRHAVESARVVIANSRFSAAEITRDYAPARVDVVYNGVDTSRFRPDATARGEVRGELGVPARQPVALFLGTGFRRKGLDRAIAALPRGVELWVAGGDRPWRARPGVRFLGSTVAPERLLQAADLLLLPTRYDAFANTCLEALACGIPAVTTPTNGAAEVLPAPWMVADDTDGLRAGVETALSGDWRDACLAVAARHDPATGYARAFELLREASRS